MSITYETFANGNTAIKHSDGCVLGFMVEGNDPAFGTKFEVLYAVTPDGRVFESAPIPCPNTNFDGPNRKWQKVDEVPAHACWIGHYHVPSL